MIPTVKKMEKQDFNEPMVVFPLKQYEALVEYIEDMEDRLDIMARNEEPTLSQEEVDNLFKMKYGEK
jgi:hypothetical protein